MATVQMIVTCAWRVWGERRLQGSRAPALEGSPLLSPGSHTSVGAGPRAPAVPEPTPSKPYPFFKPPLPRESTHAFFNPEYYPGSWPEKDSKPLLS